MSRDQLEPAADREEPLVPSRRSVLRGVGAAGIAATALAGLGSPALAATAKAQRPATSADGPSNPESGKSAIRKSDFGISDNGKSDNGKSDAGESHHLVAHVRDARTGEIDVYQGTSHVRLRDAELASRLVRAGASGTGPSGVR